MKTKLSFISLRIFILTFRTVLLFQCLFFSESKAQSFNWAINFASQGVSTSEFVTTDDSGYVYVTGFFQDSTDFDPGPGTNYLTSIGTRDIFLAKLDSLGNLIWVDQFGGSSNGNGAINFGYSIAVDMFGNIYLSGAFMDTTDIDPGPGIFNLTVSNGRKGFIAKFNKNGDLISANTVGGSWGESIVLDKNNHIYVSGHFYSTVDFDPGPAVYNLTAQGVSKKDIFICKYDSLLNFVWVKQIGGTEDDDISQMIIDYADNLYLTGYFSNVVDFDPGPGNINLTADSTPTNSYILKLDSSGNFQWVNMLGADISYGVSVGPNHEVYITGSFSGTTDFNPLGNPVINNGMGQSDFFVSKYDNNGGYIWTKVIGGSGYDSGNSIASDSYGNIYIAGRYKGNIDADPGPGSFILGSGFTIDMVILKFDSNGNFIWAGQITGGNVNIPFAINLTKKGELYVCGYYDFALVFDINSTTYTLTSPPSVSALIFKIYNDKCSNLQFNFDSVSVITCQNDSGYAEITIVNAIPPLNYYWNTNPPAYATSAYFTTPGLFSFTLTDSNSCISTRSVLITGPAYSNNFDLTVHLVSGDIVAGMPSILQIDALNKGCTPATGSVFLILDSLLQYDSAIPSPDWISNDTIGWNFSNQTFDSVHITPIVFVTTSISALLGTQVCNRVIIVPYSGDVDTINNFKNICAIADGSFDPNLKHTFPEGIGVSGNISPDQELTYSIQFQNTGTAEATNVILLDTLDNNLNINSLRIEGYSHSLVTEVLPPNIIKFRFDNIHLPDSFTNEPLSHGYVIFKIVPNFNLLNGTQIYNKANIYFDYNPPIITNSVINTIDYTLLSINDDDKQDIQVNLYPNPGNDICFIRNENDTPFKIVIMEINGRIFKTINSENKIIKLDTYSWKNGIYIFEIYANNKIYHQKLIIQR